MGRAVLLERLPRTHLHIIASPISSWSAAGAAGTVTGSALFLSLWLHLGGGIAIAVAVVLLNALVFAGFNSISKALYGVLRLSLLVYVLPLGGVTALMLIAFDEPVLRHLDPWVTGMALLLAFGRIGCLMAGCCHGKACRRGVHYPWFQNSPAKDRIPIGPLRPVQAYEAFVLFMLSVGCSVRVLGDHIDGDATVLFASVYGCSRFGLDFLRWDSRRSYIWRLTRSQWLCLTLIITSILLACVHPYGPDNWLHISVASLLVCVGVALQRSLQEWASRKALGRVPPQVDDEGGLIPRQHMACAACDRRGWVLARSCSEAGDKGVRNVEEAPTAGRSR